MGSDRARNTYDASRQYRSVVAQQGRVVIEADLNEAQEIAAEEVREEALDFVGPHGTPTPGEGHDNGYEVVVPAKAPVSGKPRPDFEVKAGTMYVGGMRVTLLKDITYWGQQENEWVDLPEVLSGTPSHELVYLHLREQEVSAVEDEDLREVALGGPDTSQRTRLIQHIVRVEVPSKECKEALAHAEEKHWNVQGVTLDEETMRLLPLPATKLQVHFVTPTTKPGSKPECEPSAQAGYLGAENQLIRIQVSKNKKLLWGYDNASHLYRVDFDKKPGVVTLRSSPVDAFHYPRPGQVMEVLRAAVRLENGEYLAAHVGDTFTLSATTSYDPDSQSITLGEDLYNALNEHLEDLDPQKNPAFFVRIWEQEADPTGKDMVLGNTGVCVHLTGGAPGDYWMFALRPSTPQKLYPRRYINPADPANPAKAPAQPPDGPRQWACPLAIIEWTSTGPVITDCRREFDNLVDLTRQVKEHEQELEDLADTVKEHEQEIEDLKKKPVGGGCCTVTVGPTDLNNTPLPKLLSDLVSAKKEGEHITVCLKAGTYKLKNPLRLKATEHLTIESCGHAVLEVETQHENQFLDGVIVLEKVKDITLRGLDIKIPQVLFKNTGASLGAISLSGSQEFVLLKEHLEKLSVGIGIRLVKGTQVTIEGCRLDMSAISKEPFFSAGIFANDTCTGLEVRNNHFSAATMAPSAEDWKRMAFGYLHTPSTKLELVHTPANLIHSVVPSPSPTPTPSPRPRPEEKTLNGAVTQPQLDEASFQGNQFSNLSAAVFLHANPGTVRLERNRVRDCYAGFWLMSLHASAHAGVTAGKEFITPFMTSKLDDSLEIPLGGSLSAYRLFKMGLMLLTDALVLVGSTLARGYPLPSDSNHLLLSVKGAETGMDFLQSSRQNLIDFANQGNSWLSPVADVVLVPPPDIGTPLSPHEKYEGLDKLFGPLHRALAALEKKLPSPSSEVLPSLHVSDNDVETGNATFTRSTALTVWHAERPAESGKPPPHPSWSLVLSANRLWNRSSLLPTARILNVDQSTVTGNMLINRPQLPPAQESPPWSLFLIPGKESGHPAAVAITGNVFIGQAALPKREGAQLPSWQQLNTLRNS